MTISSIIVLCAIVSAFLLFAGVLAWGDFYSRKRAAEAARRRAGAAESRHAPAQGGLRKGRVLRAAFCDRQVSSRPYLRCQRRHHHHPCRRVGCRRGITLARRHPHPGLRKPARGRVFDGSKQRLVAPLRHRPRSSSAACRGLTGMASRRSSASSLRAWCRLWPIVSPCRKIFSSRSQACLRWPLSLRWSEPCGLYEAALAILGHGDAGAGKFCRRHSVRHWRARRGRHPSNGVLSHSANIMQCG